MRLKCLPWGPLDGFPLDRRFCMIGIPICEIRVRAVRKAEAKVEFILSYLTPTGRQPQVHGRLMKIPFDRVILLEPVSAMNLSTQEASYPTAASLELLKSA